MGLFNKSKYIVDNGFLKIKDTKKDVLNAIETYGVTSVMYHLGPEYKTDRSFMEKAIKINGAALEYASDEIKNDKELVIEAIKQDGKFYQFASPELKADKEIVNLAIEKYAPILRCVPDRFKNDPAFVLKAVKLDYMAIQFASDELKANPDFMKRVFSANPEVKDFLELNEKDRKDFVVKRTLSLEEKLYTVAQYKEEKARQNNGVSIREALNNGAKFVCR